MKLAEAVAVLKAAWPDVESDERMIEVIRETLISEFNALQAHEIAIFNELKQSATADEFLSRTGELKSVIESMLAGERLTFMRRESLHLLGKLAYIALVQMMPRLWNAVFEDANIPVEPKPFDRDAELATNQKEAALALGLLNKVQESITDVIQAKGAERFNFGAMLQDLDKGLSVSPRSELYNFKAKITEAATPAPIVNAPSSTTFH